MGVIKRFAYVPLLALGCLAVASMVTTPGRWSVSLVLVWMVLSAPAVYLIDRKRTAHG